MRGSGRERGGGRERGREREREREGERGGEGESERKREKYLLLLLLHECPRHLHCLELVVVLLPLMFKLLPRFTLLDKKNKLMC